QFCGNCCKIYFGVHVISFIFSFCCPNFYYFFRPNMSSNCRFFYFAIFNISFFFSFLLVFISLFKLVLLFIIFCFLYFSILLFTIFSSNPFSLATLIMCFFSCLKSSLFKMTGWEQVYPCNPCTPGLHFCYVLTFSFLPILDLKMLFIGGFDWLCFNSISYVESYEFFSLVTSLKYLISMMLFYSHIYPIKPMFLIRI
ncbi:hypothetical protein L9F63_014110, partial [Diploptera punctata]